MKLIISDKSLEKMLYFIALEYVNNRLQERDYDMLKEIREEVGKNVFDSCMRNTCVGYTERAYNIIMSKI